MYELIINNIIVVKASVTRNGFLVYVPATVKRERDVVHTNPVPTYTRGIKCAIPASARRNLRRISARREAGAAAKVDVF